MSEPPATAPELPIRSLLFAPASEPRKLARLGTSGADAVVVDLEDAVPDARKDEAREAARQAVPLLAATAGALVCVRVNGITTGRTEADLAAVVVGGLDAVVLPKADDAAAVRECARLLDGAEAAAGLPAGRVRMLPLVESGAGVAAAREVAAASERVEAPVFGSGDFTLDLELPRLGWSRSGAELLYARAKLVVDAAAAGRRPPIDGPWLEVADLDGFAADCRAMRELGFQGRLCIHPSQVAVANGVFAPDPEELELCRRVVERFRAAEAGSAAMLQDGLFVDYAIARKAERLLAVAAALRDRERRRAALYANVRQ
jgi:citrate lyase subunit beta / citryl-CoA lyase